jgi:hypothetical protein
VINTQEKMSSKKKLPELFEAIHDGWKLKPSSAIILFSSTQASTGVGDHPKFTALLLMEDGTKADETGVRVKDVFSFILRRCKY